MADSANTYCARCAHDVAPVRAWPGYLWIKRGWYGSIVLVACLSPVIFSEITVLMPIACAIGFAGGPIHMLAGQHPTCSECGGPVK